MDPTTILLPLFITILMEMYKLQNLPTSHNPFPNGTGYTPRTTCTHVYAARKGFCDTPGLRFMLDGERIDLRQTTPRMLELNHLDEICVLLEQICC